MFLQNKPRCVVKHCLIRYASAGEYTLDDLRCIGQSLYEVKSQSNETEVHTVHLGNDDTATKCSCPDFLSSYLPCKHLFAVLRLTHNTWESLSPLYRQSPYLNLDSSVLSDKALENNENELEINLPADFVLEVPTKDEVCQMSDITENAQQKQIMKIRTELRNNIKVLDDLTLLSSSEKDMSEINTIVLSCIKCLQGSVDFEGNLMKHKVETVQMSSATTKLRRQLPKKKKQIKRKVKQPFLKVKDPNVYGVVEQGDHEKQSEVIQDRKVYENCTSSTS